jgi:hypothetical protein
MAFEVRLLFQARDFRSHLLVHQKTTFESAWAPGLPISPPPYFTLRFAPHEHETWSEVVLLGPVLSMLYFREQARATCLEQRQCVCLGLDMATVRLHLSADVKSAESKRAVFSCHSCSVKELSYTSSG